MPTPLDPAKDYDRLSNAVCTITWAIEESHLDAIVEVLTLRGNGMKFTPDELQARLATKFKPTVVAARQMLPDESAPADRPYQLVGTVAVLPVQGVLTPRASWMTEVCGMTSTQQLGQWINQAVADKDVTAIVMDVDSPGGDAKGNAELAAIIREARGKKPIKAVVTGMGASAAYYVASAADEVIVSPSSEVGSIGTFTVHSEYSKQAEQRGVKYTVVKAGENKAVGNPYEPLSDNSKAVIQERVDGMNALFVNDVAANRGVSAEVIQTKFGQGKVMLAQAAVTAGLADRVGTLDAVLAELNQRPVGGPSQPTPSPMSKHSQEETTMAESTTLPAAAPVQTEATTTDAKVPTKPAQTLDAAAIRAAERERVADLRARGELIGVSAEQIDAAINDDLSVSAALDQWTKSMAKDRQPARLPVTVARAGEDKFFAAAEDAILHRLGAKAVEGKPITAGGRDLRYTTLLDLAAKSLEANGVRIQGLSPDEISTTALGQSPGDMFIRAGDFTARTTDFPNLMASVANRILMASPDEAGLTFDQWSSRLSPVPDFNPRSMCQTGQFPEFDVLMENENFRRVTTEEQAAWIQADQFGQEWAMSAKMIQNNSLDAFSDAIVANQMAHDAGLNRLHVNLLLGNGAICYDGLELWHANHSNLVSGGGAPALDQLQKMRLLLRAQKGIGKAKRRLAYMLNLILGGITHETALDQVLGTTKLAQLPVATADANVNVFRGNLDYAIEAMLDDEATSTAWYGFTKNPTAKPIVHVFQQGFERMKVRTYYENKNNSRIWQFEGRYAVAVRDWKGLVKNPGA